MHNSRDTLNNCHLLLESPILDTLANILSAIKHSAFLTPTHTSSPALRPSHALCRLGEWVSIRENSMTTPIEIQQVIISLKGTETYVPTILPLNLINGLSIGNPHIYLSCPRTTILVLSTIHEWANICHRSVQHSVKRSFGVPKTTICLTHQQSDDRTNNRMTARSPRCSVSTRECPKSLSVSTSLLQGRWTRPRLPSWSWRSL